MVNAAACKFDDYRFKSLLAGHLDPVYTGLTGLVCKCLGARTLGG